MEEHIHVKSLENEAKFWLSPVQLAFNYGYRSHELKWLEAFRKCRGATCREVDEEGPR